MMPYQTYAIARSRIEDAQSRAATRRMQKSYSREASRNHGVADAVGHGLIALGSRLVADRTDHPPAHRDRHAA